MKIANGTLWSYRIYVPILNQYGKKIRKEFAAKTKAEAKRKAEMFLEGLEKAELAKDNIKVSDWVKRWLESKLGDSSSIRTYDYYERNCRLYILPRIGDKIIQNLKSIDITEMLQDIRSVPGAKGEPLSASTVNGIRRTLNALFEAALDNDIVTKNIVKATKKLKEEKSKKIALDRNDLQKLVDTVSRQDYIYTGVGQMFEEDDGMRYNRECVRVVVIFAICTGARIGEVFGLSWRNFDSEKNFITFEHGLKISSKGKILGSLKNDGSFRTIKISKDLTKLLVEWKAYQDNFAKMHTGIYNKDDYDYIFTNTFGKYMHFSNFRRKYFIKAVAAAGLPKKP